MFKIINKIGFSISLTVFSAVANASLITNGSFEQLTFDDNSQSHGIVFNTDLQSYKTRSRAWDVFTHLPGWETSYGNGIELQKNVVTRSQNGAHHVELDSHPRGASNAVMSQTIDSLTIGNNYLLEFYYKPRTNNLNDNGINVFWYDSKIDFNLDLQVNYSTDSTRNLTPNWTLQTVTFIAQAVSMDLSFGSFGQQNTLGGLIDNISLNHLSSRQPTTVPEPSMLILFSIGLALLMARQRKWLG